jgi:hypothetical protein
MANPTQAQAMDMDMDPVLRFAVNTACPGFRLGLALLAVRSSLEAAAL